MNGGAGSPKSAADTAAVPATIAAAATLAMYATLLIEHTPTTARSFQEL
jgi:hypothetical protein